VPAPNGTSPMMNVNAHHNFANQHHVLTNGLAKRSVGVIQAQVVSASSSSSSAGMDVPAAAVSSTMSHHSSSLHSHVHVKQVQVKTASQPVVASLSGVSMAKVVSEPVGAATPNQPSAAATSTDHLKHVQRINEQPNGNDNGHASSSHRHQSNLPHSVEGQSQPLHFTSNTECKSDGGAFERLRELKETMAQVDEYCRRYIDHLSQELLLDHTGRMNEVGNGVTMEAVEEKDQMQSLDGNSGARTLGARSGHRSGHAHGMKTDVHDGGMHLSLALSPANSDGEDDETGIAHGSHGWKGSMVVDSLRAILHAPEHAPTAVPPVEWSGVSGGRAIQQTSVQLHPIVPRTCDDESNGMGGKGMMIDRIKEEEDGEDVASVSDSERESDLSESEDASDDDSDDDYRPHASRTRKSKAKGRNKAASKKKGKKEASLTERIFSTALSKHGRPVKRKLPNEVEGDVVGSDDGEEDNDDDDDDEDYDESDDDASSEDGSSHPKSKYGKTGSLPSNVRLQCGSGGGGGGGGGDGPIIANGRTSAPTLIFDSKQRRSKLPLKAVYVLREFFVRHVDHPFPNDAQKRELAGLCGLNFKQVSDWFTNTRKRFWKPYTIHLTSVGCTLSKNPWSVCKCQANGRGGQTKKKQKINQTSKGGKKTKNKKGGKAATVEEHEQMDHDGEEEEGPEHTWMSMWN